MKTLLKALLVIFVLILILSSYSYIEFKGQRQANIDDLKTLKFDFETTPINGNNIVDLKIQRYTDVTYLDLVINIQNKGGRDVFLKNPLISFYLEDVIIEETTFEDQRIPSGEVRRVSFNGVTFTSEKIDEALKGRTDNPEEVIDFSANVSSEYEFIIQDINLRTYRLVYSFGGDVLLRQIFGGKTQEEAVVDILGLNKST
jgi:hypothetical protein